MFEAFSRSWEITKLSFEVIKKDKELLLFPILSGIFSIVFIIAILFPAIMVMLTTYSATSTGTSPASNVVFYVSLFVVYFGLAVIATFFNVCTVYTIKKRFEGGNATFGESIKFGFSKLNLIFAWSLISATVGIILKMIENTARRSGGGAEMIIRFITGLLGAAWSVITIFVIPVMVYKNLGPMDAIKSSVQTLKKTWGESLIRELGIGLITFLFFFGGFIFWALVIFLSAEYIGVVALLITGFLALTYLVAVVVFFSLINSVFNTALYVYAEHGKVPVFKTEVLKGAFRRKN